jgi:DNA-directed RNA polymerase specialized sigma24 family protein
VLSIIQEESPVFDTQFSRCRGLLYFTAYRVLDDSGGAEEAVQNCLLTATRNTQKFESEGAFRSWLLRIVIDEALQILRQKKSTATTSPEQVFLEER